MSNMKWSRFNYLAETKGYKKYLYNSYSNSLIELESSLYNILTSVAQGNSSSLSALSEEEINSLKTVFALVENDDVEYLTLSAQ